jgi:molybdopterin-guanine dinucleotide biosynthesis protein A
METAGFVLAGGRSSRMGRDKSLLELEGEALVERAARRVSAAAGSVALVGDAGRHAKFGWPVVVDLRPGQGPLGGIESALASPFAGQWNLIVACDMPYLDPALLEKLIAEARFRRPMCITAYTAQGVEPLCAVYAREFLDVARRALDAGQRKVRDAFAGLYVVHLWTDNEGAVTNVNTPAEWASVTGETR